MEDIQAEIRMCLDDLQEAASLKPGDVLVIGASTSEILGQHIGKATSLEVGLDVVNACMEFADDTGCSLAFQCCEHLNRALVVEKAVAKERGWRQVSAIPVPGAGGAVAAQAYFHFYDCCLVEEIEADAGLDIGDTLIGMHLRRVAVPVRGRSTHVGKAHITMARTRPPLIGGLRAVYDVELAASRVLPGKIGGEGAQNG